MKQFLFPMLIGLLFSQFAFAQTNFSNQDSEQYTTSQKLNPSITISASQRSNGYYRDANGLIHEFEGNESAIPIERTSSYYRMIKRNSNLTVNKFTKQYRMVGELKNEKLINLNYMKVNIQ